jgi:hypothetical protein
MRGWIDDVRGWIYDRRVWIDDVRVWIDDLRVWIYDRRVWIDDVRGWIYDRRVWIDDVRGWIDDLCTPTTTGGQAAGGSGRGQSDDCQVSPLITKDYERLLERALQSCHLVLTCASEPRPATRERSVVKLHTFLLSSS